MKFYRVDIENFGAIGRASVNLSDRGLLLVQGQNNDDTSAESNGSGKSTIADALSWALFGKTARGVTGDAVVNRTAKKDCRVEVVIYDGDDSYVVHRGRKPNTLKLSFFPASGVSPIDFTQGTEKLTQEKIEKVLGCSYDVFTAAIYAGQEHMPDLPAMTDKALKVLIEGAAGISLIERAYEIAKGRVRICEEGVRADEQQMERVRHAAELANAKVDAIATAKATWVKDRADQIETLKLEAGNLIAEAKGVLAAVACIDRSIAESTLAELVNAIALVEDEKLEERRLGAELSRIDGEHAAKVAKASSNKAVLLASAQRLKDEVEAVRHDIGHLTAKIGQPCLECGKAYAAEDLVGVEAALKRRLADRLECFRVVKNDYERSVVAENDTIEARRTATEAARSALQAYQRSMTDVTVTSARAQSLREKIGTLDAAELRAKVLKEQARQRLGKIELLRTASNPHEKASEEAATAIKDAAEAIVEAESRLEKTERDLDLTQAAAKVYGPAGVRAEILDTVTPYLNSRTAHYLGTLSDGNISATWSTLTRTKAGELKEKFCIEVDHKEGGSTFAELSGGEKRKVRLACALALQDLVATRASKPIDLFIGDEIDHALDQPGLERLTAVLEEKARERGTVIVISHSDLSDWIRNVITVVKSSGKSVLTEAV